MQKYTLNPEERKKEREVRRNETNTKQLGRRWMLAQQYYKYVKCK